jgi:hypothetical protein
MQYRSKITKLVCTSKDSNNLKNDPDQTAKPFGHTKLCEKCNVQVTHNAWGAHLKGETHLTNKPYKLRKLCEKCNIEMATKNWPQHLRSKTHLENNPDEIIKPIKPILNNVPTTLCEKM